MGDVLDGRLTEPIEVGYIYEENVGAAAPDFAREKLGIIEDLIESGELMNPAVKPNDTVYFVYKDTVVLEGRLHSVFSDYDPQDGKYYYHVMLQNDFYRLAVQYPAAEFNRTWFKTREAAEAALAEIQNEEAQGDGDGNDPEENAGT